MAKENTESPQFPRWNRRVCCSREERGGASCSRCRYMGRSRDHELPTKVQYVRLVLLSCSIDRDSPLLGELCCVLGVKCITLVRSCSYDFIDMPYPFRVSMSRLVPSGPCTEHVSSVYAGEVCPSSYSHTVAVKWLHFS